MAPAKRTTKRWTAYQGPRRRRADVWWREYCRDGTVRTYLRPDPRLVKIGQAARRLEKLLRGCRTRASKVRLLYFVLALVNVMAMPSTPPPPAAPSRTRKPRG